MNLENLLVVDGLFKVDSMNVAVGKVEYMLGTSPITGCGVSWSGEELDVALAGPVAAIVFDHEGTADVAALLESLPSTDFESDELVKILDVDEQPNDWEVGEAIAESYLIQHRDAFFPWPHARDIRKPKSSLPGADMIGFHGKDDDIRFAFGEVKTSQEQKYPPQVVRHGEHSLNKQLSDLRNKKHLRDKALKYLGFRATNTVWNKTYQSAVKNYLKTGGVCVAIFGVLVRDVTPNPDDLETTWKLLSENCHEKTLIELWAIYLPPRSIDSLGNKVMAVGKGGDA